MFKPQIRIPATYMRGGKLIYNSKLFLQLTVIAAKKCYFSLLASTNVHGGNSLYRRGSANVVIGSIHV